MNRMTTRQKLRLQLPHKNTKILKYYYKKLTKIKHSRRANIYSHCASTSIVSSMASREFLKLLVLPLPQTACLTTRPEQHCNLA